MKNLGNAIRKFYNSGSARWLFSFLCALALVALAALLSTLSYFDNDDLNIAWALAGYRTGVPSFAHPFINCVMAAITSALYTVVPKVPWWLVLQLGAIVAGMTAVFASLLKICAKRGVPLLLALALIAVFGGGMFYYGIVLVTFTLSAAIAGAGATALVLAADAGDGKPAQRWHYAGAVALLCVSLLVRNSTGLATACFVGGAMLLRAWEYLLNKDGAALKRVLTFLLAGMVAAGLLVSVNAYGREAQNPPGFVAYDEARSSYMDYPHDSFTDNPQIYADAGWDEAIAAMTSGWFYMDERVTTQAFRAISDHSAYQSLGIAEKLQRGVANLTPFFQNYPLAVYYGLPICVAYAVALALFLLNRKRWLSFFGASAFLLGTLVLFAYLIYTGRLNLRVWMTMSIFAGVSIWLCAVSAYGAAAKEKRPRVQSAARIVILGLALLLSLGVGYKVFRTVISYEDGTPELLARSSAVTAYAQAHPENVYIRDVYAANNVDALSVYPDNPPTNLIDWGGCDMNTATREKQLAVNHLDSTWAKDLFRLGNVYYIGDANERWLPLMEEYMTAHCGATGYEVVESVYGSIVAVRFLFGGAQ